MTWQSIGTAPKDGRLILLRGGSWSDDCAGPFPIAIARWHTFRRFEQEYGCWLIAAAEAGYSLITYDDPTEWSALDELD